MRTIQRAPLFVYTLLMYTLEAVKHRPRRTRWFPPVRSLAAQPPLGLFTTSITQAEILHGVLLLPEGGRRTALEAAARAMFREDFAGRVLPFGPHAAEAYARIAVHRHRSGRPIAQLDA